MDASFDHIERELAGIATRLEAMERDHEDEKRLGKRTPGGLLLPKTITLPAPSTAHLELQMADLAARVSNVEGLLARVAKTQAMQQAAIEELSLMATFA